MKVFLLVSEKNRLWVALLAILLACGATRTINKLINTFDRKGMKEEHTLYAIEGREMSEFPSIVAVKMRNELS